MFGIGKEAAAVGSAVQEVTGHFSGIKGKIGKLFKLAGFALAATGAVNIYKSLTEDKAKEYVDEKKVFYVQNKAPESVTTSRADMVEADLSSAGINIPVDNGTEASAEKEA